MEALDNSNCNSLSDSFSLYERYMRSFSLAEQNPQENNNQEVKSTDSSSSSCTGFENFDKNIADNAINNHKDDVFEQMNHVARSRCNTEPSQHTILDKHSVTSSQSITQATDLCLNTLAEQSMSLDHSVVTEESSLTNKSDNIDLPVSSEDTKSDNSSSYPKPVIITSLTTMENSNNAVDSVPMFHDVRHSETVFKLPITELSFMGTIKNVQKLKPIVDPITALSSSVVVDDSLIRNADKLSYANGNNTSDDSDYNVRATQAKTNGVLEEATVREHSENRYIEESTGSMIDSQCHHGPRDIVLTKSDDESGDTKYSLGQSYSSLEASFDSCVRSPDIFSEGEEEVDAKAVENFWEFVKDYEVEEKSIVNRMETLLHGILPPPSVTHVQTDVTEMLKRYYCFLPAFSSDTHATAATNPSTPTKGVSFIKIPQEAQLPDMLQEVENGNNQEKPTTLRIAEKSVSHQKRIDSSYGYNNTVTERKLKYNTEHEIKETAWPHILKCKYHDMHYNITRFSEKLEFLALKCSERFVGAETASSVTVYSGSLASPSSASKRKAFRIKLAQGKSPGRRLSHLARRRQTFCSAATINEKMNAATSKMVLIDKNYFSHKKLISVTSTRKSPKLKRTPGKKTPAKKTPAKKTPGKAPNTRSGGSSKKKAMRRLLIDSDSLSRTVPSRETSKRALFVSPENGKVVPEAPSTSASKALKSRRALFGSPSRGSTTDISAKRKRDDMDGTPESDSRNKIPKSLSFGGDTFGNIQVSQSFYRRSSEMGSYKTAEYELNELHKQKLLWAVSEALRVHGWRLGAPGFREKAAALFRLTRRLLALPEHRARLLAPRHSTSEIMLKLARQYVFAIIQGRTIEECVLDEQSKLTSGSQAKVSGYISASTYQEMKARQAATCTATSAQIKENSFDNIPAKPEQPRTVPSATKNILQDKLVNIDSNSNSNSGLGSMDKMVLYKSNSMPSFDDAAKMRARRQISFDNVQLPKR